MGVTRLAVEEDVDGVVKPISAPSRMYPSNFASRLRRLGVHAGADRSEDVDPRDIVLDIADVEDPLDRELDVLVRLFRLEPRRGRNQAVGGAEEGRAFGSTPNSSVPLLDTCPPLYERDTEFRLRDDIAEARFWSEPVDIWRTKGDGASSSSLSLHPRPVVRPMPPRSSLPSRWRTRRLTVSRSSLNSPFFVIMEPAATLSHVNHTATDSQQRGPFHAPAEARLNPLPGRSLGSGVVPLEEATSFEFGESSPSRTMSCLDTHPYPNC